MNIGWKPRSRIGAGFLTRCRLTILRLSLMSSYSLISSYSLSLSLSLRRGISLRLDLSVMRRIYVHHGLLVGLCLRARAKGRMDLQA